MNCEYPECKCDRKQYKYCMEEQALKDLDESADRFFFLFRQWGMARGIIQNGNVNTQTLKLVSEVGELADNMAKGRYEAVRDDLGDIMVVIAQICGQLGITPVECMSVAWEDIKDRKGYLNTDGVFVKEGDNG